MRSLYREIKPAGFILFSRNVEDPAQVRELNRELHALLPPELPPLLSVDQEGGRVQRVKEGATAFPPLRWVGNTGDPELVRQHAIALAREVAALGFNVNWSPVTDVDSNPDNPVIGDRAYSRSAAEVAACVETCVEATQSMGLMSCAKHFPGHGDTSQDSHEVLPIVEKEAPDLSEVELLPFRAAIRAGVAAVMSAHVVFPAWDPERPATMSAPILDGILRGELGFKGLLVSDDMEMKAVRGRYPLERQLQEACEATMDLFLVCHTPELQQASFEALVRLQEEDPAQERRAMDSEKRLLAARERFFLGAEGPPPLDVLACREHTDLVMAIRAKGESA